MPCACAAAFAMLMSFHSTPGIVEFTEEWREGLSRDKRVCEVAVSGNGSRRIRCEAFDFRWGVLPLRTHGFDLLLIGQTAILVRETESTYKRTSCSCASPPRWISSCEVGRGWGSADGIAMVNGMRVEQRRVDIGDASTVIRFAPDHDCEQMERVETRYRFGLPVARQSNTVTRLELGEPDASRFRIPYWYREAKSFPPERNP